MATVLSTSPLTPAGRNPGRGGLRHRLQLAAPGGVPAGLEPGLEATSRFEPANGTFPFGTHICVVEVDRETGAVELKRYVAVDDCGNVINPLIVDGQVHGGIAQGLAQALYEEVVYDAHGQLVTGSLMDYAVPRRPCCRRSKPIAPSHRLC